MRKLKKPTTDNQIKMRRFAHQQPKKRKPRTKSREMCVPCGNYDCDPMWPNTPAKRKIQARFRRGLCPGCGNKDCSCKSA